MCSYALCSTYRILNTHLSRRTSRDVTPVANRPGICIGIQGRRTSRDRMTFQVVERPAGGFSCIQVVERPGMTFQHQVVLRHGEDFLHPSRRTSRDDPPSRRTSRKDFSSYQGAVVGRSSTLRLWYHWVARSKRQSSGAIFVRGRDRGAERCRQGGNPLGSISWTNSAFHKKETTKLGTDNTSARDLAYNPEHHDRTKHIERCPLLHTRTRRGQPPRRAVRQHRGQPC